MTGLSPWTRSSSTSAKISPAFFALSFFVIDFSSFLLFRKKILTRHLTQAPIDCDFRVGLHQNASNSPSNKLVVHPHTALGKATDDKSTATEVLFSTSAIALFFIRLCRERIMSEVVTVLIRPYSRVYEFIDFPSAINS